MENKEKNNIYYRLLMISAIIIPVIIGFSYAYFLAVVKVTDDKPTTIQGTVVSDIDFELVDENNVYITASNLIPLTPDQISIYAETGNFTVRAGNNPYGVIYTISLTDVSIPNELKTTDFKWRLICTSCSDTSKNAEGDFSAVDGTEMVLKSNLLIDSFSEDNYKIMIWLDETGEDQIDIMNKTFSAKVKVQGEFAQTESSAYIPSEYQIVEYIESTGTQYILTDIIPNDTMGVYTKLLTKDTSSSDHVYIGATGSIIESRFFINNYGGKIVYGWNDASNIYIMPDIILDQTNEYELNYLNSRNNKYNDVIIENITTALSSYANKPLAIFASNAFDGTIKYNSSIKLYKLKISEGTNISYNFIPAYRKSDGEVGLFDIVNNVFYQNAGTGDFIKGPNV